MPDSDLPTGYTVRLGPRTHRCDDGSTLVAGGSIIRLRPAARGLLTGGTVEVRDPTSRRLARLLLDRGLAEPWWSSATPLPPIDETLTIVIPVLDRPESLDRLLRSLPPVPVTVVDDCSRQARRIADVTRRHRARLIRHDQNRGPAAARNTGLRAVRTPLVAFIDSDVVLDTRSIRILLRHLEDPRVGLVAPRIRGLCEDGGALARYEAARSSLDLGPEPALVHPHARVSYVPSAMLLARRAALGGGFDETMPVAEDVDLVWRVGRDWSVRYEPLALVRHEHRTTAGAWFSRKVCYGSGAALLAERHGRAAAPAVLTPWNLALTVAVLAQRRWSPALALGATVLTHAVIARRLRWSNQPSRGATALLSAGVRGTLLQVASALTRHYVPVTLAATPFSRRVRRAYAVAVVAGGLVDYRRNRPRLDPARYVALRAADDVAYGLGLWRGAFSARSVGALMPLMRPALPRLHSPMATHARANPRTKGRDS